MLRLRQNQKSIHQNVPGPRQKVKYLKSFLYFKFCITFFGEIDIVLDTIRQIQTALRIAQHRFGFSVRCTWDRDITSLCRRVVLVRDPFCSDHRLPTRRYIIYIFSRECRPAKAGDEAKYS